MHCFFTDLKPPLGHHHVPPSQQGAPESEGAVSVDRVVAGGQNTQVKPHLINDNNDDDDDDNDLLSPTRSALSPL